MSRIFYQWHSSTSKSQTHNAPMELFHPSVRVSSAVCFHSNFWTNWLSILIFFTCTGHDQSSTGIGNQGYGSRSKVSAERVCYTARVLRRPMMSIELTDGRSSSFPSLRHGCLHSVARYTANSSACGCGKALFTIVTVTQLWCDCDKTCQSPSDVIIVPFLFTDVDFIRYSSSITYEIGVIK